MEKNQKEFEAKNLIVDNNSFIFTLPVMLYLNPDMYKKLIIKENNGKAGVYKWTNKITGKSYIGSSINLGNRIKDYFNYSFLTLLKNKNMIIYKSSLKYGYSNFKLEILEYSSIKNIINREQYYMDLIKPEYNNLSRAGSSYGFKHSKESLLKLRIHLNNLNAKKGYLVEVLDKETKIITTYLSIRKAALAIKANHKSLIYSDKVKKPVFGRYNIIIKRK